MAKGPSSRQLAVACASGTEVVINVIAAPPENVGPINIDNPFAAVASNLDIIGVANISSATGTGGALRCYRVSAGQAVGVAKAGTPTQVGTSQAIAFVTTDVTGQNVAHYFQDLANANPQQGYFLTYQATGAAATVNEVVSAAFDQA
jgi:hypothetical protein